MYILHCYIIQNFCIFAIMRDHFFNIGEKSTISIFIKLQCKAKGEAFEIVEYLILLSFGIASQILNNKKHATVENSCV